MKIAIDAMGGDNAPHINIEGSRDALAARSDITKFFLVGDEAKLLPLCKEYGLDDPRVEIVHTDQVVEMHESGATTLRSKKKSSISIATGLVKSGDADAVISAGNTGAPYRWYHV